jgi:hypothetical protein
VAEAYTQITEALPRCTPEQRRKIFDLLRREFPIHEIEQKLNATAEVICEAIHRASDLTLRGVRGVIAEASFEVSVVKKLQGWTDESPIGDHPYDFLLKDHVGRVRVQIKMQRQREHKPMTAKQGYRFLPEDMFVVETQRTRGGTDSEGASTRPYRFDEFDILGVSMHPSCNEWDRFLYTVANWLVPNPDKPTELLKFQPVPKAPNEVWSENFETAVEWFRSKRKTCIWTRS